MANYSCIRCGSKINLVTHHWCYDTHGYEIERLDSLSCICGDCHAKLHDESSEEYKRIKTYYKEITFYDDNDTIELCKEWCKLRNLDYDRACYKREDFLNYSHNIIKDKRFDQHKVVGNIHEVNNDKFN